ncbi:hypothetical protein UK23_30230 [Lentzea aerocolonigenes]|uniref:Ricin B lectin domain-containing protein n=1 Tax=Lentzea aerocolonigenes TaxID=68170 RepID=A0A0F0GQI2_LENAE|nr:RICIN domain-containing protein [Lentzea aerocolonigenes]KJK44212.1 hypothetical protein UK23_30230 [Lentzea aerocolonigenes]
MAVVASALIGLTGVGNAAAGSKIGTAALQVIKNVGAGNGCMDLTSYAPGTAVTLYQCNSSANSQWFDLLSDGTFRSYGSGLCMDVSSYTVGAVVHMEVCHGGTSQKFDLWGDYTISAAGAPNLCLDLRSYNNGTPVILAICGTQGSQKWAQW